jgi:DNA (cytosine-5)-methyltransferase 1
MLIGSLCTGYGGLDHAAKQVFNGHIAWVCDNSKAASKVLAYQYPFVPNLGDLQTVDWETIPKIDVLTAGFPCQPVSVAGRKLGKNDDRWIWPSIIDSIRVLRPRWIVLENVPGILRLGMGDILGSLASEGYDVRWQCVSASDVGAPHTRNRWFAVAYPHSGELQRSGNPGIMGSAPSEEPGERDQRERSGDTVVDSSPVASYPQEQGLERRGRDVQGVSARGCSPDTDSEGLEGGSWEELPERESSEGDIETRWGRFGTAIGYWESFLGRCAPVPLIAGKTHKERLNPVFVEWMMGLPEGWVTGVPGLSYREQLHLLGNGVVPQQAASAIRLLAV